VHLAPDGRSLVTAILGDNLDLWTYSLERRILSRLTTGIRTEFAPFWTRDGDSVLFALDRPPFEIYRMGLGASREASALWTAEEDTIPTGLSADGRLLVYTLTEPDTGRNVWVAPIEGGEDHRPFRATRDEELYGSFSPDGRWLTYQSDETGRWEIYVQAYPGPGERFQISPDGGYEPLWAHGSGEIFYRHGDEMRVVRTRTGPPFEFDAPQTLFELSIDQGNVNVRNYDVTPDGKRILAIRIPNEYAPRRIDLITNWLEELERLVPK
jgi:Tol biopolymer transport system component